MRRPAPHPPLHRRPGATALALVLMLAAGGLQAQAPDAAGAADPLKSAECGRALQALDAARAAGGAVQEAARRRAAQLCLGAGAQPGRPPRVAQPPVVVPPPSGITAAPGAPGSSAAAAPVAPLPPVPTGQPPLAPTACDAGGCWDTQGRRLPRAGDMLLGPGGAPCTVQAGAVLCP